jgi:hypothetical protein
MIMSLVLVKRRFKRDVQVILDSEDHALEVAQTCDHISKEIERLERNSCKK